MAGGLVTTINDLDRLRGETLRERISRAEWQLLAAIPLRNHRNIANLRPDDVQDRADPGTDEQPPKPARKVCR